MGQFRKLLRLFTISPKIEISKVLDSYSKKLNYNKLKEKYLASISYSQSPFKPEQKPYNFFQLPYIEEVIKNKEIIEKLAENFINHNFNLLGSGWTKINFKRITYNNHPNKSEQEKIGLLMDKDYNPIDWQIDFKSGYRWSENTWYKDIKYGNIIDADIKVPWELGRMQHLSLLALAKTITNYKIRISNAKPKEEKTNQFVNEFQNQILDFISSNPPGFGVQWSSSMDIAIRAVNWLVSYSLLKGAGTEFNEEFEYYFIKSIYEHGKHIIENLEWSSGMRGNHYLANLAGMLFIASHLPETDETNSWLNFAINELCNEILYQFNEDGSNFEASTNYHYFSAEIVFSSISLILALPKEKIPVLKNQGSSYYNYAKKNYSIQTGLWSIDDENLLKLSDEVWNRLIKIYKFSSAIMTESGTIPQIGDNDSGQLLITNYKLRITNDGNDYQNERKKHLNQFSYIQSIMNSMEERIDNKSFNYNDINILSDKQFNDFGLYILENKGIRMFIRCGSVGQNGKGGHSHNDQLSFELFIDNKAVIVDPGTFVYTPNPEIRNEYRSTKMHNTLSIDGYEQNYWDNDSPDDLFWLKKDKAKARMIEFSDSHFIGEHYGFGKPHRREIKVGRQKSTVNSKKSESDNYNVIGIDTCELNKLKKISFHFAPNIEIKLVEKNQAIIRTDEKIIELKCIIGEFKLEKYFYSPCYGVRIEADKLVIESQENRIEWQIEIKQE